MLDQSTKLICEDLARLFLARIAPWGGRTNAKVLWTERPRAVPARWGVTLSAEWCETYARDPRISQALYEAYPNKPHGAGIDAMIARDQWRQELHVLHMPDVASPWEPLLQLWELGVMIDRLEEDRFTLVEYTR